MNYSYFKRKGKLTSKKKIYLLTLLGIGGVLFTGATIASLVHIHD